MLFGSQNYVTRIKLISKSNATANEIGDPEMLHCEVFDGWDHSIPGWTWEHSRASLEKVEWLLQGTLIGALGDHPDTPTPGTKRPRPSTNPGSGETMVLEYDDESSEDPSDGDDTEELMDDMARAERALVRKV